MNRWFPVPDGLDLVQAAALPMTVDTAFFHLSALGLDPEKTILIHGAGTTIGFAAVQIALLRVMRVTATAGQAYAQRLRDLGAQLTSYGDGMVERVTQLNGGPADLVLNTAPVGGSLPDLVRIAGGDPKRVLTISDFAAAAELGVRDTFHEDRSNRADALPEFGHLAADGTFTVPIAATFALEEWKTALEITGRRPSPNFRTCSASSHPHSGKHCARCGPAALSSSTAAAGKRPGTSKRSAPDSHQADQPPANPSQDRRGRGCLRDRGQR